MHATSDTTASPEVSGSAHEARRQMPMPDTTKPTAHPSQTRPTSARPDVAQVSRSAGAVVR